jgi:hypothetical protein
MQSGDRRAVFRSFGCNANHRAGAAQKYSDRLNKHWPGHHMHGRTDGQTQLELARSCAVLQRCVALRAAQSVATAVALEYWISIIQSFNTRARTD